MKKERKVLNGLSVIIDIEPNVDSIVTMCSILESGDIEITGVQYQKYKEVKRQKFTQVERNELDRLDTNADEQAEGK